MAVNATAVWRVRPSGSNTNGGGFDTGISGYGTDYSQQDAAQIAVTDAVTNNTTTVTSATASFTSAHIGNAINLTGTGTTTGFYYVTAVGSSTSITVDRATGSTGGTGVTLNLGGGWADFWTNTTSVLAYIVAGNTVYILGGASPSYASPDYAYGSSYYSIVLGTTTAPIHITGDPSTPSTNGYGGRPLITTLGNIWYGASSTNIIYTSLFFVAKGASNSNYGIINSSNGSVENCVLDQNGYDIGFSGGGVWNFLNCEAFSSAAKISTNVHYGIYTGGNSTKIIGCNAHDCIGGGIEAVASYGVFVLNNIAAKNGGIGIYAYATSQAANAVIGNTIDGNGSHGLFIYSNGNIIKDTIYNNIISNHIGAGAYGLTYNTGTTAVNDAAKFFIDYNTFYNNTTNYNAISAGAHDTALGTDPYVDSATQNYTLA